MPMSHEPDLSPPSDAVPNQDFLVEIGADADAEQLDGLGEAAIYDIGDIMQDVMHRIDHAADECSDGAGLPVIGHRT